MAEDEERKLKMIAGSFYKPKRKRGRSHLGEDAHFVYSDKHTLTIGVADGVGGWAQKGIDSGIYARELMLNAIFALKNQPTGAVDPKQVMHDAWLYTKVKGSSTACIITLRENFLHAANLGDSGFMVIRGDGTKFVYKSPIQQRYFNCPFQLGMDCGNSPNESEKIVFQVEQGDILVAGTDGLFDNLFPEEIVDIVKACLDKRAYSPMLVARSIGQNAVKKSRTKDSISPFTKAAMDAGRDYKKYKGGKKDDITVLVGYIFEGAY